MANPPPSLRAFTPSPSHGSGVAPLSSASAASVMSTAAVRCLTPQPSSVAATATMPAAAHGNGSSGGGSYGAAGASMASSGGGSGCGRGPGSGSSGGVESLLATRQRLLAVLAERGGEGLSVRYWELLRAFLNGKLTKYELDRGIYECLGDKRLYIHNVFIKALLRETASSPQIARISASKRPGLEYFVRLPGSPAIGLQPQQLLGLADLGYVAQPLALLPEFARKRFTSVATHGSASRSIAFQDGHSAACVSSLRMRVVRLAEQYGVRHVPDEVFALLSIALETYLKNLLSRVYVAQPGGRRVLLGLDSDHEPPGHRRPRRRHRGAHPPTQPTTTGGSAAVDMERGAEAAADSRDHRMDFETDETDVDGDGDNEADDGANDDDDGDDDDDDGEDDDGDDDDDDDDDDDNDDDDDDGNADGDLEDDGEDGSCGDDGAEDAFFDEMDAEDGDCGRRVAAVAYGMRVRGGVPRRTPRQLIPRALNQMPHAQPRYTMMRNDLVAAALQNPRLVGEDWPLSRERIAIQLQQI